MTENEALKALKPEGALEISGKAKRMLEFFDGLEVARKALEIVAKMKEHCEGSCTDCPYHNPKFEKCMNDLLKGE